MSYNSDRKSAYEDIKDAGAAIVLRKNVRGVFTAATETFGGTTASLSASISTTVTTLTLKSASATFATKGVIQIGTEKLLYTSIVGSILSAITRGYDGTTAASHATNAVTTLTQKASSTYGVLTKSSMHLIDGTLVKRSEKCIIVPAFELEFAPDQGIEIEVGGVDWLVKDTEPLEPDNTAIIYKAYVDKN